MKTILAEKPYRAAERGASLLEFAILISMVTLAVISGVQGVGKSLRCSLLTTTHYFSSSTAAASEQEPSVLDADCTGSQTEQPQDPAGPGGGQPPSNPPLPPPPPPPGES